MKKKYETPQTETVSVEGRPIMLALSSATTEAAIPGMDAWNTPGMNIIDWDELSD